MADLNDSFSREVKEEIQRERMTALWKQYGSYLIAAVVTILLALAGYKYWQNNRLVASQQAGENYTEAAQLIKQGKLDEGLKALEAISKNAPGGYEALSQLQIAGAERQSGKTDEAIKTYEKLVAGSADPILRDYATLQIAALQLGKADFTVIKNRLNHLLADDNAYRFSARELVGLAAYQAGNLVEARGVFDKLMLDASTPPGMAQRTRMMLARISANEIGAKDAASAKPSASSTSTPEDTKPATTSPSPDVKPATEEQK
ncbi:MAG: tetratricopeptide repeat protein [Hyphomicrobiaceae bacterium]